jgi:hypothetical protein
MSQQNLIGLERAKVNLPTSGTGDENTINILIGAASDLITKYCRREFLTRSYDEFYNGDGDRRLLLRNYPLQTVESVRYRPVTVLKVINNAGAGATSQSRVQVMQTGLQLMEMSFGVKKITTSGLDYVSCPTLYSLAQAVSAVGRGWSAQVVGSNTGDYGAWPSSDLYVGSSYYQGISSQGALTAMGQFAELKMHTYELSGYQWDSRGWLLRAIPYTDPELLHPEDLIWPLGINNFRVQYTAGYTEIPEAVQEACARLTAYQWFLTQRDPALAHQVPASGTSSGWQIAYGGSGELPGDVRMLLAPYRRYSMSINQG